MTVHRGSRRPRVSTDREALLAAIDQRSGQVLLVTVSASERPCVTPVSVSVVGEAKLVEVQCLGDVLGDQILMTPLEAWRQPHAEFLFAA